MKMGWLFGLQPDNAKDRTILEEYNFWDSRSFYYIQKDISRLHLMWEQFFLIQFNIQLKKSDISFVVKLEYNLYRKMSRNQ